MEITEVKVFPVRDKKLRAFVSIVLDSSFMVNDIKIIRGKDGLFISMPSRRKKNGRFKDIAHPLNQETRQVLEERIITAYRRVVEEAAGEASAEARPADPALDEGAAEPAAEARDGAPQPAEEPAPPAADAERKESAEADDKSLEEVAEAHLSDSYWTT
jgi:stage V sporulation protein G